MTLPDRIKPMLAQIAEPFDSDDHLFEIKWDGTRCVAYVDTDRFQMINRRDIEMRTRYPELDVLQSLPAGTILDAEIVVLENGLPSFGRLQQREHLVDARRIDMVAQRLPATMMVFDVLYSDHQSLLDTPLVERKQTLSQLVSDLESPHVLAPEHIQGQGVKYFDGVAKLGLEGIMAKRTDSRYSPGKRSPDWRKIKVAREEPFEVIGFTVGDEDESVSALVVAERARKGWAYKAKVGSGFTLEQRRQLFHTLSQSPELPDPPDNGPREAIWRATGLTCLVRYFEKTPHGFLRAPVFKGFVS